MEFLRKAGRGTPWCSRHRGALQEPKPLRHGFPCHWGDCRDAHCPRRNRNPILELVANTVPMTQARAELPMAQRPPKGLWLTMISTIRTACMTGKTVIDMIETPFTGHRLAQNSHTADDDSLKGAHHLV